MKQRREQIVVDNSSMNLVISQPDGNGPFAGVILIQHQEGVDPFMEEMTERAGAAGFFAVSPDLYHRDGPDCKDDGPTRRGRARDVNIIRDVNATVAYLKNNKFVDGSRIGILGFCMGGRVAYLMAASNADLKAAVAWYPGSCFRPWGEAPTPFERTPQISCPIQGHFGATDPNPTLADMEKISAELSKFGKAHEFHVYHGAGHAFMDRHHVVKYNAQADQESWPRAMAYLKQHLNVP
jgi:carboxymethylenebutenolidase